MSAGVATVDLAESGRPVAGDELEPGAVQAQVDGAAGDQAESIAKRLGHDDAFDGVDDRFHWGHRYQWIPR